MICSHNRSAELDRVLRRLFAQEPARGMSWSVLVVDNASTDDTAEVVASHAREPKLRYVYEPTLGLTHARQRGVAETTGEWIAFVDDDNLLEPNWVAAMADAIQRAPNAGGFGGRVLLQWEVQPPEATSEFGFCFAEQNLGDTPRQVETLNGAGMALNREALIACGWATRPMLPDRIGTNLVSGGDVEIALRVRGAGYALWYRPEAVMQHLMPASRATPGYLLRISRSLGATAAIVSLLGWSDDYNSWRRSVRGNSQRRKKQAIAGLFWSLRRSRGRLSAVAWLAFALGYDKGVAQVRRMSPALRDELLGLAVRHGA